ncbi:hypothetical protein EBZ80_10070 [bacterium]|nr:hypothetical protein [bacterium]
MKPINAVARSAIIKSAILISSLLLSPVPARAQNNNQPPAETPVQPLDLAAMSVARQVLTTGAAMVALGDSEGVAGQFTDDGELVTKSTKNAGPPEVQIFRGADQLLKWFKIVEGLRGFTVVNNVEYARLVAPDLLYITGTLELTSPEQQTTGLPFTQVRVQEGASWKIVNYQIIFSGG